MFFFQKRKSQLHSLTMVKITKITFGALGYNLHLNFFIKFSKVVLNLRFEIRDTPRLFNRSKTILKAKHYRQKHCISMHWSILRLWGILLFCFQTNGHPNRIFWRNWTLTLTLKTTTTKITITIKNVNKIKKEVWASFYLIFRFPYANECIFN